MKKIKYFFVICLIFCFIFINFLSVSYGFSTPVTKENLNTSLQNFATSEYNTDKYQITVQDNEIQVKTEQGNYTLNYDLTGKPTFSISVPISQGISYKEFNMKTDSLYLPMLGYIGVANTQGVSFEDAPVYFELCLLESLFSNSSSETTQYIIASDGTNVTSSTSNVIYESDFGNHVIEYTNSIYNNKDIFSDTSKLNSFTLTIEKKDVTSTSCNLVSTLTINTDTDFSKIKGFIDSINPFSDITESNANYFINLKVGQKCIINSVEKITGYGLMNINCVDIDSDYTTITALKPGIVKGNIYLGNENNKKTIYIVISENTSNSSLTPVTLNITSTSSNNSTPFESITNTTNSSTTTNSTNTTTQTTKTLTANTNNSTNTTQTTSSDNISNSTNTVQNTSSGNTNTITPQTSTGYSVNNISTIPNAGYNKKFLLFLCYTTLFLSLLGLYKFHRKYSKK